MYFQAHTRLCYNVKGSPMASEKNSKKIWDKMPGKIMP